MSENRANGFHDTTKRYALLPGQPGDDGNNDLTGGDAFQEL